MPAAPPHASAGHGDCDVFLHVQTKRAGKVKGEARSAGQPAAQPTALTAWISSAATFCASPYSMRVLSR